MSSVVFAQSNNEYHDTYIKKATDGSVYGNSKNKNGSDNKLYPNRNRMYVSSDVKGDVYGGYATKGNANNNSATIYDGTTINGDVYGGYATKGNANNNSVTIYDGTTINGNVYGGYATKGNANNNGELLASIAFIRQGSELIADEGISAAVTSLDSISNMSDIVPFVAFVGGKSKYDTGLHIDISGVSLVVGGAKGFELEDHKITAGAFIEHGDGKYKSLNTIAFDDIKDVKANAIAQYTGGGLLGRVDFSNNFYAEVSGRAGSAKSNFHSDDIKFLNKPASYNCDGMYLGTHIGSGYIYEINNKLGLDVSGKYFFTHQRSKDVELPTKEIIKFADTSSHRIRLGAKLTYEATEVFKPYVGGAFEYEFAGKVDATLAGFDINAPALKGGSGMGEFGVTVNVDKFLIDFGGRCHAGVRTGIDGMLKVKRAI
ncbi:autotransporter outer membrane beta-barrel domain-containing protein [Candidatus Endomicrobiellum pyrsonymphae]|uniref:autotransporter outer membrane beta-barrel domain-containing protein n=1 Tax=Candidatus Endomicrobiellum pyrsonymphae TaxID=1408203 RepID=UPI0035A91FE3